MLEGVGIPLLALALAAPGTALAQDPGATLDARIDAYLEPYLETGNFSGSILIGRRGEVLFSRGYGWANRELEVPNTPQTAFHLASVSRVFTATAILRLVDQGSMRTADPVSRYLPAFPHGEAITIDNLLTLSAGFADINSLPGYAGWSLEPQTAESLVAKFEDLPLEYPPGERSEHSNSNYNLLALLLERVSGRDYGAALEHEIFAPLGMRQTTHDGDPARLIPHRAAGYTPAGVAGAVNAPWLDWSVKTGHGSLVSTVEDLYRFDRALAGGGFLSDASRAALFTERFENSGYGWFIRPRFGDRELYINGRSPGFGSYLGRLEEHDLTVIVLGNLYSSQPTTIARDLMAIVLGEPHEQPRFSADPLDPELLSELLGDYQFGPDFYSPDARYSMTAENGQLMANGDWLMPAGDGRFIHRIYGSELEFLRDAEGRVTAVSWDGFLGRRATD